MHEMWTVVIDTLGICQSESVCHAASHSFAVQTRSVDQAPAWGGDSCRAKKYSIRCKANFAHRFNTAFTKLLWLLALNSIVLAYGNNCML